MASAGAIIDIKRGKIELRLGKDLHLKFDVEKSHEKLTIDGHLFAIEGNNKFEEEGPNRFQ